MHRNGIYFLYRLTQVIGFPLILLYFLVRGLRDRAYFRRFGERLGLLPESFRQTPPGGIWLHAVSVGEVISAVPLMRRLRAELPHIPLYVSTTTLAGRKAAEDKLGGLASGVFYAPIDYCFAVRRALRLLRPQAVVVMETEIWPNLFRQAKRFGCGLLLVNGRISDKALPRYERLRWFFRPVLEIPDAILAQNEVSRRRFVSLGAPEKRVRIAGNLKYDFDPNRVHVPEAIARFVGQTRAERVWIAASTMPPAEADDPDEDDVVIGAFQELAGENPGLLLILAPRKPERFDAAAEKLAAAGVRFVRRSALPARLSLPGVLLLDSIGELSGMFSAADFVFMGGTLPHRGGHNILEPAFFARPVIIGPHMENFPDIAEKFSADGACYEIRAASELAGAVRELLRDGAKRAEVGSRARFLAEAERGATARVLEEIRTGLAHSIPVCPVRWYEYLALWPLTRVWLAGSWWKRRRARRERLATPVISVGGVTAGGAGKSPLVLWLAQRLRERGRQPAILTRGYRRQSPEPVSVFAAGEQARPGVTGDEAQAYLRSGVGPVGISADRASAGRLIEERFRPGVFLLDDGFQHWRLERDLDIVAIDALAPFGCGHVIPLGRLREPLNALSRAGIVVINRAQPGRPRKAIEAEIRKHTDAPIFAARTAAERWTDAQDGTSWPGSDLPFQAVAAFCGLGNPASFRQTLAVLGVNPVLWREFGDHHHYTVHDLLQLALEAGKLGAEALLTTEKDLMNLSEQWEYAVKPLRLCWLSIGLEMEDAEGFLREVEKRLPRLG